MAVRTVEQLLGERCLKVGSLETEEVLSLRKFIEENIFPQEMEKNEGYISKKSITKGKHGISADNVQKLYGCSTWRDLLISLGIKPRGNRNTPKSYGTVEQRHASTPRINPETNDIFHMGEVNEQGLFFMKYHKDRVDRNNPKYCYEHWTTAEKFKNQRLNASNKNRRNTAIARGLEYEISDEIETQLQEENSHCQKCGVRLRRVWEEYPRKEKNVAPHSFTIDRVDSNRGYTLDNIQVLCHTCNSNRGEMTNEQEIAWAIDLLKRENYSISKNNS